jgi:YggT family protein
VQNPFALLTYWYFHIPNFLLAALMYTLLGRALLSLFVDANSENYIWRFFCRVTDPFLRLIGKITPRAVPPQILWLFGFVWVFWLRVLFLYVYALFGLLPRAS